MSIFMIRKSHPTAAAKQASGGRIHGTVVTLLQQGRWRTNFARPATGYVIIGAP
jgi:hypothetical protein